MGNDLSSIVVGTRMERRGRRAWEPITIIGLNAERFAYQDENGGAVRSCAAQEMRRSSRYRPIGPLARPAPETIAVAPLPNGPRKLPPEVTPEPIVSAPEDMGVRVHMLRGHPVVIAAAVGRALGYADDGKSLVDVIRKQWTGEMVEGRDFAVLRGVDLADFKARVEATEGSSVGRAAHLMVLYETGWDIVCLKTEKPEGVRLRRRLADEVLPKARRGEPVTPALPAPMDEARIIKLVTGAMAAAMPQMIAGAVEVLKPLMLLPASAPVDSASDEIPPGWLTHGDMAERLPITRSHIERLIRGSESIRADRNLCRVKLVERRDMPGSKLPCFYYHPSVLDIVRRLAAGAVGEVRPVEDGSVSAPGTDVDENGRPVKK